MADDFLKWATGAQESEAEKTKHQYSIAPGVVTQIFDSLAEGRVEVRIPSCRFVAFARLVGAGGGMGKGFLWVPQVKDEVLVAFNQADPRDAYIIGGVWSTFQRPPLIDPVQPLMKRVIQTGVIPGIGHKIEFDDLLQSITIKTPLEDKVAIGPGKVEISTAAGLLSIKLNLMDTPPTVSIESTLGNVEVKAPLGNIKLNAELGSISLNAMNIEINGTVSTSVSAPLVKIN